MRIAIALGMMLALGGCSLPDADLRAEVRGNDLVFTASIPGILPFSRETVDIAPDLVRVDDAGRTVWRIERKSDARCQYPNRVQPSIFPLVYGRVPDCFTEVVRAAPLKAGTLYRIAAIGMGAPGAGQGYFRTGMTVKHFDSDEIGNEAAGWNSVEEWWPPMNAVTGENAATELPDGNVAAENAIQD